MTNLSSACVFIADDDEDDRYLLARAFTQHSPDCAIHFAEDGLSLLADIERAQPPPYLIILDLNMPRLDGFETLAYLRAHPHYRDIPVVILTTSEADVDRQRARELGADLFLTKPIDSQALGQAVLQLQATYLAGKCC